MSKRKRINHLHKIIWSCLIVICLAGLGLAINYCLKSKENDKNAPARALLAEEPSIKIVSPRNNSSFALENLEEINFQMSYSIAENHYKKIEFFHNQVEKIGEVELGDDSSLPFYFNWKDFETGTHRISAKATTEDGIEIFSNVVTINISKRPTVEVLNIENNKTYQTEETQLIKVNTFDPDGIISKTELTKWSSENPNQGNILAIKETEPFNFDLNIFEPGIHTFSIKAYDDLGVTSETQKFEIKIVEKDNSNESRTKKEEKILKILKPNHNQTFLLNEKVEIELYTNIEPEKISKINLINNGETIAELDKNSNSYLYELEQKKTGSHNLRGQIILTNGQVLYSDIIRISINEISESRLPQTGETIKNSGDPLKINIISPKSQEVFFNGGKVIVEIETTGSQADYDIFLYDGEEVIGEFINNKEYTWKNPSIGPHELLVKAYDNDQEIFQSESVDIEVVINEPIVPEQEIIEEEQNSSANSNFNRLTQLPMSEGITLLFILSLLILLAFVVLVVSLKYKKILHKWIKK